MYCYPHGVYQNSIRALSATVRPGTVVLVMEEVAVEMPVPDPLTVRLALGSPKLAWLNALAASAAILFI